MATLEEWKATHRAENPTLTKMVDNQIMTLDAAEYDATIDSWADASYAKEQDDVIRENGGTSSRYAFFRTSQPDGYPVIEDQLDMMYHDQVNGTTTWRDAITAIKNKYKKPS